MIRWAARLSALAPAVLLLGAAPGDTIRWYTITAGDGTPIGYASHEESVTPEGRTSIDYQEMTFQEPGQPIGRVTDRTVTRVDKTGRPIEIVQRTDNGRGWAQLQSVIGPDEAVITRSTRADVRTVRVKLPPGVRFDSGTALAEGCVSRGGARVEFLALNPGAMAVERVVIEPAPDDANARIRRRYEGDQLRSIAKLTYDKDCRLDAVTQPLLGGTSVMRPSGRETALKPHSPYRLLANVMVKSPFRVLDRSRNAHIRYRFGFRDGLSFAIPQSGEQAVISDAGGATVDICTDCGPGLPTDPAYLADALRPTVWLQSDAPQIVDIARPVGRARVSGERKMIMLMETGKIRMRGIDFTGHYSALETLQRGSGDCTEAAVLLAALARGAGIPARVVNGVVYSRERYHGVSNAFLPHSWVLAYVDGRWRSYDMALDRFDSTHIALTVGDGDGRSISSALQLASLLKWETMAEVRSR